jgi:hypothetical protein
MYSSCLFCARPFGRNESVEVFPVGKRLAFDGDRGRLWVVCEHCTRWCLVPIEERWEAIESCERQFRDTRQRVSTDQIGLARLRDGLELVRVGKPLRPELAAWRYGREFSARRRRAIALSTVSVGVGAVGLVGGIAAGGGALLLTVLTTATPAIHAIGALAWGGWRMLDNARAIQVPHDCKLLAVNREELKQTVLVTTDDAQGWGLELKHAWGRLTLTGDDATRATTRLLARANGAGADRVSVSRATSLLDERPSLADVMQQIAANAQSRTAAHREQIRRALEAEEEAGRNFSIIEPRVPLSSKQAAMGHINPASLALMQSTERLAFEMALHEERERAAMEGELEPLRAAWAEAEQVAAIADGLLVPPKVEAKLDALRAEARRSGAGD